MKKNRGKWKEELMVQRKYCSNCHIRKVYERIAEEFKVPFYEGSAKSGENIDEDLVQKILIDNPEIK